MKILRRFRRFLAGSADTSSGNACLNVSRSYHHRVTLLRMFYVFVLFVSISTFDAWSFHLANLNLIPLWPLAWTDAVAKPTALLSILGFQALTALVGVFFCGSRTIRVFVFLGLLEYVAMRNSYGKIGHSFHLILLISFLLIFLPRHWNRTTIAPRLVRTKTLLIFTACQFAVMLSYSLAGLGKLIMAFYQFAVGQIHAFHPDAFALHVAQRLLETPTPSVLGSWMIDHGWLVWPLMPATLYLQFFAIFAVLRPSLHKLWAAGLILFHAFSFLVLTINFPYNCFVLGLFFLTENQPQSSLRRTLADLPLFGIIFRLIFAKRV